MKKNEILENILVEKLVFGGKGFARLKSDNKDIDGKAIFISGGVIPGSIVNLRILKSRKDYIDAQCQEVVKKSPIEKSHPNNIFGDQAGSMWVNIPYEEQLKIKSGQIEEALFHIKKLEPELNIKPIVPSPLVDGYRNKIEFSFGKYISAKEHKAEHFNVGFHKQGEFSKIEDFDGTILISDLANKVYKEIKDFAASSGYPVYDQFDQKGFFRHIVLRQAFFTNQIMIIFSINHKFEGVQNLDFLNIFFNDLAKKYPEIKSIYLSLNDSKADVAIGKLELIYGEKFIEEELLGITFNISPKSFFQTNSYGAEKLYSEVLDQVNSKDLKDFTVLDLYGGTGTIGMVFASHSKKVISVELVKDASEDGKENAIKNNIKNMDFVNAKVEEFLGEYLKKGEKADLLIIDPPRAGMHPDALPNILKFKTKNIIYVSCNPATLSRDLAYILQNSDYKIMSITPVDMFPHTPHIETIVKLERV
ncbi:MAG: 23S rRNA (uracil(1939)-C(5))-methyltransferase RlmD [Candidatus Gracilibacteria bacterium]|nr:23S rRNA (uracil(1939)-C(5))-methyltransferase RlmD [Candidatus Gracilibacteria bacterium]